MEPNLLGNTTYDEWKNLNLTACIKYGHRECNPQNGDIIDTQLAYFCGQGLKCVEWNNRKSLLQAKKNVEKHFPVVVVLEHIHESLVIMEKVLPKYFKDVTQIYKASMLALNVHVKSVTY